jgi:pimeloyl-ACP methyl ester carboxylesterase
VERSRAVVDQVPGVKFKVMPNLGHFPMSENPQLFLTHLLPVLDEIAAGATSH